MFVHALTCERVMHILVCMYDVAITDHVDVVNKSHNDAAVINNLYINISCWLDK